MTLGEYGGSIFLRNVGAYLPNHRDSLPNLRRFFFRERISVLGSQWSLRYSLWSECRDSLTLEAGTYDWALRLPYEILKPMITPPLVNFEFYLHLVKVLMKIIAADLSLGIKIYSKNRSSYCSYMQMNRLFRKGTMYLHV